MPHDYNAKEKYFVCARVRRVVFGIFAFKVSSRFGYWVCSVAGRDQAHHTSLRRATVASHTVSRQATVAKQSTVYLAMPLPVVAT